MYEAREVEIVHFDSKHEFQLQFCCILNGSFYCGLRDPDSSERVACDATIAIAGEDGSYNLNHFRNEMFQMNRSVFLMQACAFHCCGGIRTTSTTEEVGFNLTALIALNKCFHVVD